MKTLSPMIELHASFGSENVFVRHHVGYWNNWYHQRTQMDNIGERLSIKTVSDWYGISRNEFSSAGGQNLLTMRFNGSQIKALSTAYPDTDWQIWRFERVPYEWWSEPANVLSYLEWIAKDVIDIVFTPMDWHNKVNIDTITRNYGQSLLYHYDNSLWKVLQHAYSWVEWQPWRFEPNVPLSYWKPIHNQRSYFDWVGEQLGIVDKESWYLVRPSLLLDSTQGHSASIINGYYGGSPSGALRSIFQEVTWQPWLFNSVSKDFWGVIENQQAFATWLESRLKIQSLEDWYKVSPVEFSAWGGAGLLDHYGGSICNTLANIFPHFQFFPWLFHHLPNNFWNNIDNKTRFMEWVAQELGIKKISDWYRATQTDFTRRGGNGLLLHYKGSVGKLLRAMFPSEEWKPWIFEDLEPGFWKNKHNRRAYFDWLAEHLNVSHTHDWYNVQQQTVLEYRGTHVLVQQNKNALSTSLMEVYPHSEWYLWKFHPVPAGFWDQKENRRIYLDWLEEELEIDEPEDWYRVTWEHVIAYHGASLLQNMNLVNLLVERYPHFEWDPSYWEFKAKNSPSKAQIFLCKMLKRILPPDTMMKFNYVNKVRYGNTHVMMELDIWVPKFNLAFEYQGKQHYFPNLFHSEFAELVQRDFEKGKSCNALHLNLIPIPYWWNFKCDSLAATISKYCPEAVAWTPMNALPISGRFPHRNLTKLELLELP